MLDVPHGIGTNKSAFNAPITLSLTVTKSVFQSQINALLSITLELALAATLDTTLIMENAL